MSRAFELALWRWMSDIDEHVIFRYWSIRDEATELRPELDDQGRLSMDKTPEHYIRSYVAYGVLLERLGLLQAGIPDEINRLNAILETYRGHGVRPATRRAVLRHVQRIVDLRRRLIRNTRVAIQNMIAYLNNAIPERMMREDNLQKRLTLGISNEILSAIKVSFI